MYNSEGPREWLLDPGTACPSPGSRDLLSRAHLKFSLTENPHLSQNSESAKNPLLPHLKKKKRQNWLLPPSDYFQLKEAVRINNCRTSLLTPLLCVKAGIGCPLGRW